ncbi:MAG: phosphatase PAP2 family protein [Chryseolinea sp.]
MLYSENEYAFVNRAYAVILILFSILSVSLSPIQGVLWINSWSTDFFDLFFSRVTHFGNGVIIVPFLIILSFRKIYLSIALAVSGLVQGLVVLICKRVLFPFAERPISELSQCAAHFISGVNVHHSNSFPSGHTVTIFGLCIFLSLCFKNRTLTYVLLILATIVGISRVYLLQHYITDVAVGSLIGSSTSIIVFHFFENMNKPTWMTNAPRFRLRTPSQS